MSSAVSVSGTDVRTDWATPVKVPVLAPCLMVIEVGSVSELGCAERLTVNPPLSAGSDKVTVPVTVPVTEPEATTLEGVTVSFVTRTGGSSTVRGSVTV